MFKWLTTTKKGFTLVELMVVVALLGLGTFALVNLISVAYRSQKKTEERYTKQETVKNLADFLQKRTNIGKAQSAAIFNDPSVVPRGIATDESFAYVYCELSDVDGDGVKDGYYLYKLEKGAQRAENPIPLNPDAPLYITIDAYQAVDAGINRNQAGVIVHIAATEESFVFEDADGHPNVPTSDDIYYSLDVTYHFPNMVTADEGIRVNFDDIINHGNTEGRATGTIYDVNGNTQTTITGEGDSAVIGLLSATSVDKNGCVLRIASDSVIAGEETAPDVGLTSFCFIATASYGKDSGEVGLLCDFRDKCLLTNPVGTAFVKAYYEISPPIADFIAEHESLKAVVRASLKPMVIVAQYALHPDLLAQVLPYFALFGVAGGSFVVYYTTSRKKRRRVNKAAEKTE